MAKNDTARNIALHMLTATLEQGVFSHVVLKDTFDEYRPEPQERKFLSNLYQGTLEKLVLLDAVLNRYSKTKTNKMKPVIRNLLRLSVYQLLFMDAVPDRAVLSEALKICSRRKMDGLKPFVNGVLRSVSREKEICMEGLAEHEKQAVPQWLYDLIREEYDPSQAAAFFAAVNDHHPHTTVRLLGEEKEETVSELKNGGCTVNPVLGLPAVRISNFDSLTGLAAFRQGKILVQGLSSMLVAECIRQDDFSSAAAERAPLILDVCAAPGGKSLDLADRFPQAQILSMDLSEQKIRLIRENLSRTGIVNVTTLVHDARTPLEEHRGQAAVVICDLPCSGIGVIGHKPDIRFRLKKEDITQLAALQRQILTASAVYVRPGGILLYSTCTVTREENLQNALWFAETEGFDFCSLKGCIPENLLSEEQKTEAGSGMLQLLNGTNDMDGFFLAKFRKRE